MANITGRSFFALLLFFFTPALNAQEVTFNCGTGGKLVSVVANGNRTVLPGESNVTQRLASLRKDIEQKRKKYLSEICADADACLGQLSSGDRSKWRFRDTLFDIGSILAHAVAIELDRKDAAHLANLYEERKRLTQIAETDPDAFIEAAKESLEKMKALSINSNPATASAAFESIEKMLSVCRNLQGHDLQSPQANKKSGAAETIKLEYPNRGINRNKVGQYDRRALEKVLEHALLADIDPYAALAIVMLEDAPVVNAGTNYRSAYGRIPVDAIGAFDTLGCFSSATRRKPVNVTAEETLTFRKKKAASNKASEAYSAAERELEKKLLQPRRGQDSRQEFSQSSDREQIFENAKAAISSEISGYDESADYIKRSVEYQAALAGLDSQIASLTQQLAEARKASESSFETAETETSSADPAVQIFHLESQLVSTADRLARTKNDLRFAEDEAARAMARQNVQRAALLTASKDREMARVLDLFKAYLSARDDFSKYRENVGSQDKLEELECLEDTKMCQGRLQAQVSVPTYDLRSIGSEALSVETTRTFCSTSQYVKTGSSPDLFSVEGFRADEFQACCAEVKSNLSIDDSRTALLSHLGAEFFRRNIQTCFGTQPVEMCLQKFNGMGCFGCTEKMPNNCYDGIVGSDRPIYGARAADLMLNTLMPNPEISELIGDVAKKIGRSGISGFCRGRHEGKLTIASNSFFEMQKRFLLEGAKTSHLARIGNGLRKPASATELDLYKKREAERAKHCSVHFK